MNPARLQRINLTAGLVLVMMCTLAQHPDEARAAEAPATDHNPLQQQVAATERAFAKTMADRDLAAFGHFVSAEAVFVSDAKVLRGRQQVVNGWRKLYEGKQAPFSWEPQTVEVLDSQHLALSRGPVHDATGKLVGTFTSIWRLEAPNTWRIIFDSGCEACERCAERGK